MLNFNKLCRTTNSGQVALIMHPPVYDFPWNTDGITSHAQEPLTFGAAAQHDWPRQHVDGLRAHHASSRHAGNSSILDQGLDIQEYGEESDGAFVHAAAYSEYIDLQTAFGII